MRPFSWKWVRGSAPGGRGTQFSRSIWVLGLAAVAACSADSGDRDKESPIEPGELPEAPLVFEAPSSGGTASGGSGSGSSGTGSSGSGATSSTPPQQTEFGDDSFDQFVDPARADSVYCGDGAYDPALEECDDGVGAESDVCSPNCQTRDVLAVPAQEGGKLLSRKLGLGRHPISGGPLGSALAWTDVSAAPQVVAQIRDPHGNRISEVVVADATMVDEGESRPTTTSNPVVATLPDGSHVVAYNDLNGDGNELGVALRPVSHLTATLGDVQYVNETSIGAQYDADLLWTSQGLVAAWVDTSDDLTGPDIRYRIFNEELNPIGGEETLATSDLPEGAVTLSQSSGGAGWAAAWRRGELDGDETIVAVRGADKVEFRPLWLNGEASADIPDGMGGASGGAGRLMPGHMEDRLGLAPLGEDLFAVAFTVGTDPEETGVAHVFRLWVAVVDFTDGSVPWIGPIAPVRTGAPDHTHSQRQPALADASAPWAPGTSGQVFVGWRAEGKLGDGAGEDLWLKRLDWDAQAETLVTTHEEVPLTRDADAIQGDQRAPALATVPVPGGHALSMAWEDWAATFDGAGGTQARPDVVVQVAPVPLRRGPSKELDCEYNACGLGQGPCHQDEDCAGGLTCAEGRGPWHGYGPAAAVCEPATCTDGLRNAGEWDVDCGGDCGPCFSCESPSSSSGTAHFCSAVCPCENTDGDCDSDFDCITHDSNEPVTCFEDTGNLKGLPEAIDLCLKAECQNEAQDAGEARVDCGGTDCVPCLSGVDSYCTTSVPCTVEGEGSCASDAECGNGLVCIQGQGDIYGHSSDAGVCLPTDCGVRGGAFSSTVCSAECRCPDGMGECTVDAECLGGRCEPSRGVYFGQSTSLGVCTPDQCFNGIKDANESQRDCGGPCGSECPVCPGDFSARSFEYAANSGSSPSGWVTQSGSGITWAKSTSSSYGTESIEFSGCGSAVLRSPAFSTSAFEVLGDELFVDLALVGTGRPAGIELSSSIRFGFYHSTSGSIELFETHVESNNSGQFVRQVVPLTGDLAAVRTLFEEDLSGVQVELGIDFPCPGDGAQPVFLRLDHMEMGGANAAFRSTCTEDPPPTDLSPEIFGFENVSLWSSAEITPAASTTDKTEGSQSLSADATVAHTLTSQVFPLSGVLASRVLLDVSPPTGVTSGSVGMTLHCPSVTSAQSLGSSPITSALAGDFRTLNFSIPQSFRDALISMPSGADDCTLEVDTALSGAPTNSVVLYDHIRLAPDVHCNQYVQMDALPFAVGMSPPAQDGTATRPYRLCTAGQMQTVMNTPSLWSKNFVLEADIDLSGVTGQIGNGTSAFTGTFDGQHHYLSNYSFTGGSSAGFFSSVVGDGVVNGSGDGVVRDLTLADFTVSGGPHVGILSGGASKARISNVYVAGGTVNPTDSWVGGLVGLAAADSLIEGCVGDVSIGPNQHTQAGGIVGNLTNSTIKNSRVNGNIVGFNNVGGVAGYVAGSTIESSSSTADVTGSGSHTGGLVGALQYSSTITESTATGTISGSGAVGGLVGQTSGTSVIEHSSAGGSVSGVGNVGGLVGSASAANVTNSWSSAIVSNGGAQSGGLIGLANAQTNVVGSWANGSVQGTNHSGGLLGRCENSSVQDVFATGDAIATGASASAGGLAGSTNHCEIVRAHAVGAARNGSAAGGTISGLDGDLAPSDPLYTGETTFQDSFGASTPNPGFDPVFNAPTETGVSNLTASQFRSASNFTNWDFFGVWEMGEDYPVLRKNWCQLYEQSDVPPFVVGAPVTPDGTALKPYRLCSAAQLVHVMENPGSPGSGLIALWDANYRLEADIDLSGVDTSALTYGQIGTSADRFRGTFDGWGRVISGYAKAFAQSYAGLFGDIQGDGTEDGYLDGAIENLVLKDFSVSGVTYVAAGVGVNRGIVRNVRAVAAEASASGYDVGSLVGQNRGIVEDCRAEEVAVQGGLGRTGGLVGYNFAGEIRDSEVRGGSVVSATSAVGGLVGNNASSIHRSASDVVVHAVSDQNVGGLVGTHSGIIEDCRSHGPTEGKDSTGGLVGRLLGSGSINRSEAHGRVTGEDYVGGLVGQMYDPTVVIDSLATGYVTAARTRAGGLVGYIWSIDSSIWSSEATGKVTAKEEAGGLVGRLSGATVSNCSASGDVTASDKLVGGFAALIASSAQVSASHASGNVVGPSADEAGGFVAQIASAEVVACTSRGGVKGRNRTGGFAGHVREGSQVLGCKAFGDVVGSQEIGGFAGQAQGDASFVDCEAEGDVTQEGNSSYSGGFIGRFALASGKVGLIDSCAARGNVAGVLDYAGGLVGDMTGGTIQDSQAWGAIKAQGDVGGLVGRSMTGTVVLRSFAHGTVTSTDGSAGGFVGSLSGSQVWDSFARGSVFGEGSAGGFAGTSTTSEIARAYAYGSVSSTTSALGSFLGSDDGATSITSAFSHPAATAGAIAPSPSATLNAFITELTTEQFTEASHFLGAGWNFETVWQQSSKAPVLRSSYCTKNEQIDAAPFVAGLETLPNGTKDAPFVLCNASQVETLLGSSDPALLRAYFELGQSIDLGAIEGRIGDATTPFKGTFDGKGYELLNYSPATDEGSQSGLFGAVEGDGNIDGTLDGHVLNVTLVKPSVSSTTATSDVGLLIGKATDALIEDVVVIDGTVSSTGANTGGLVGLLDGEWSRVRGAEVDAVVTGSAKVGGAVGRAQTGAAIEETTVAGEVHATLGTPDTAGGLVGYLDGGVVWQSHAKATVEVNGNYAGGLVGQAQDSALAVCSAEGAVSGVDYVGGLVGYASGTSVSMCWATGDVTSTGSGAGGFAGSTQDGSITDSYAVGSVQGVDLVGGLVGDANSTSISKTYARGVVTASSGTAGALLGSDDGNVYLSASFADGDANVGLSLVGDGGGAGGTFLTSSEFSDWTHFADAGWAYGSVWRSSAGGPTLNVGGSIEDHPCLRYAQSDAVPFSLGMEVTPTGEPNAPWPLCTASQIQAVMGDPSLWDDHFVLMQDIHLAGVTGQIGSSTVDFTGSFHGNHHRLSGYELTSVNNYAGLFRRIDGDGVEDGTADGLVEELEILAFDVSGAAVVGTLVGTITDGVVRDVSASSSSVHGTGDSVGGLVGRLDGGTILRSDVDVSTSSDGGDAIGGVAGDVSGAVLEEVVGRGTVTGVNSPAGFAGGAFGLVVSSTVRRCEAHGNVSTDRDVAGGLIGQAYDETRVEESLATGAVELTAVDGGIAGGLIGHQVDGIVWKSSASGTVEGNVHIGGLIGLTAHESTTAVILDSSASGTVAATTAGGGLVGTGYASGKTRIERSSATGNVTASDYGGGLIGGAQATTIHDSYAKGSVTITGLYAGAVAGIATDSLVLRSYGTGVVSGGTTLGAIVGATSGASYLFGSLGSTDSNGALPLVGNQTLPLGGSMASAAELENATALNGRDWDTESVWAIETGGPVLREPAELPYCLRYEQLTAAPFVTGVEVAPDGSAQQPYRLCNPAQLATVRATSSLWSKQFVLEADLDASSLTGPIGTSSTRFTGTFDGNGRVISGYQGAAAGTYAGLFGYVDGDSTLDGVGDGEIRSLVVTEATVSGGAYAGVLVGRTDEASIHHVYVGASQVSGAEAGGLVGVLSGTALSDAFVDAAVSGNGTGNLLGGAAGHSSGTITRVVATSNVTATGGATEAAIGGLVGKIISNSITDAQAWGSVVGVGSVGGLVGRMDGVSTVETSLARGDVEGTSGSGQSAVGGLVGWMNGASVRVSDSSASGAVDGYEYVGGLVGAASSSGALVEDSHATGAATAVDDAAGGLVGLLASGADVYRCWASGNVGGDSRVGGLVGEVSTGDVVDSYATGDTAASDYYASTGGLVGYATSLTAVRSYSTSHVDTSGSSYARGAFVGYRTGTTNYSENIASSTNNSTLDDVGYGSSSGVELKTATEIANQSTFTSGGYAWDFTNVWLMGTEGPELR